VLKVLLGPFVDVEQPLISGGMINVTFQQLFQTQVGACAHICAVCFIDATLLAGVTVCLAVLLQIVLYWAGLHSRGPQAAGVLSQQQLQVSWAPQ
jgi:hypothetical protein